MVKYYIKQFPEIKNEQTVNSWINQVNDECNLSFKLTDVPNEKIKNSTLYKNEVTFGMLFNDSDNNNLNYHIGTVHSVKGCSVDATLLILKNFIGDYEDSESYEEILAGDRDLINNQELRVIYVALSRAKKLLCLAVPMNNFDLWNNIFSNKFMEV